MTYLDATETKPFLGLAYGPGILDFVGTNPGLVDYVEIPFEQLRHAPDLAQIQASIPLVLHCASLSIAGFVPPSETTIQALHRETERTRTPWIGEHLAFVSADGINEEPDRDSTPTNLTYTLCPQMSEETVDRVAHNLNTLAPRFPAPLILENSPQYFLVPGSTMDMAAFIHRVAERTDIGLLLDLSHHLITARNTGTDAIREVDRLPLERVVEIHIAGLTQQSGVVWDDHGAPAPPEVFSLFERVLKRSRPRAVTLEYNWSAMPQSLLRSHLTRAREMLQRA